MSKGLLSMRSIFYKIFVLAACVLGMFLWFALTPFNFGPELLKSPDFTPHFFIFLAIVYFIAFFWAAVTSDKKIFYWSFAVAQATLAAETIYLFNLVYYELSASAIETRTKDAAFLIGCRLGFLSLIFFLPSLIWVLRWANWRNKDFLPILKVVAVVVSILGLGLWIWMICVLPSAWFIYSPGIIYFLALFWGALTRHKKRFFLSFAVAQLILAMGFPDILGESFFGVSQALADDQNSALVEKSFVSLIAFAGGFSLMLIIFFAIVFLPTLIWGFLGVGWLKPAWFKKVDFIPKLR